QLSALLKQASGSTSSSPPPGFDNVLERVESFIEFGHRWYSVRRDPIRSEEDVPTGSVHIMTDVTAQRELEQQLYHAQKMDAIGRLAGGVAHDFNNLLSVIISYGEFLVESAQSSAVKDDALEIVKAGHRAAGLTRQLLVFSRKQPPKFSVLTPDGVVNDLSKMLSRLIGENHHLRLELSAASGRIHFDKAQLEQILVNLVVNARDATHGSGEIVIRTQCLHLPSPKQVMTGELPAGRYVTIDVHDSGLGMDNAVLPRIFEPFFTTKGPGKGTGLGLAMVYGSVHQAGGFIHVSSKVGQGTQLTVYLPRIDETMGRSSAPPSWKGTTKRGQTVLVVEDETPVRAAICKILVSTGFQVLQAQSAEAALEVFEHTTQPVDILLTDIVMPGMNGVELAAKTSEWFRRPVRAGHRPHDGPPSHQALFSKRAPHRGLGRERRAFCPLMHRNKKSTERAYSSANVTSFHCPAKRSMIAGLATGSPGSGDMPALFSSWYAETM
ncbi:MAG: ATP-binding protein, partial [Myxococcota bacterium]|nr:ATP-binding protein [Myxococcota bacterium]